MIPEQRDGKGRLRVPFFVGLISEYMEGQATYEANEFKEHVLKLGILAAEDWDVESNGYVKWKHRIDRAAQRYFTNV